MRKAIKTAIILTAVWLAAGSQINNFYKGVIKAEVLPAVKHGDPLYQVIVKNAPKYTINPSDAKIDPVWKTIPGYNGLKVDIPSSYRAMKKNGRFKENKLVYEQIRPGIHLNDLPPAPIYKGNPDKPMVSFAVNVAWGNEFLPDMLATLKKHNIHASFFLEGNWVKKNPELAKMIVEAGHEVGNHSYSHPDLKHISAEKTRQELLSTNEVIEATTEVKVKWFAPPSGSYRDETIKIANDLKMKTIMWTVDTIDWQKPSPDTIIERVVGKAGNGSIVLMHPTASTAKALDRLISGLERKNLTIGTISDLMNEERIIENNPQN